MGSPCFALGAHTHWWWGMYFGRYIEKWKASSSGEFELFLPGGLFLSTFGAKTPFVDLNITFQPTTSPELLILCRKVSWFLEMLEDQPWWPRWLFFFFPPMLPNQVVHQGLNYLTTIETHLCQAQGCRFTFILCLVAWGGQPWAEQEAGMQSWCHRARAGLMGVFWEHLCKP